MKLNWPLKEALLRCDRHAYQVAAEVGISETKLSRIVRGRLLAAPEVQEKLATALGRTTEELFTTQQEKK